MLLHRLRQSQIYRLMRKAGLWSWLDPASAGLDVAQSVTGRTPQVLRRIVIDLTPVLPNGENGGAKVMTLELVRQVQRLSPTCEFILLTSGKSHDELAHLDGPSVTRVCVDQPRRPVKASAKLTNLSRRLLARILPGAALERLGEAYQNLFERRVSGRSLVAELNADLLFCPFTAPFFFDPSVPMVSVIYDLQHVFYPQFFEPAEARERERNLQRTMRLASKVVCISEYVTQTVLDHFKAPSELVQTIHIKAPSRLAAAQAGDAMVLASLGLQQEGFFLYPANFWPHKNHELLLTVFGQYCALRSFSGRKLVLTGSPSERRDILIEASRQMGLSAHIVFPGYLPEANFGALMNGCLAVIFPSLFEGFGMPVLEAMAAGKPVLCSNSSSLPEVAGGAALLFDPHEPAEMLDAIMRVEQDSELRRVLSERGRQRIAEFGGPEEMAALYLSCFQAVVEEKRNPHPPSRGLSKTAG